MEFIFSIVHAFSIYSCEYLWTNASEVLKISFERHPTLDIKTALKKLPETAAASLEKIFNENILKTKDQSPI